MSTIKKSKNKKPAPLKDVRKVFTRRSVKKAKDGKNRYITLVMTTDMHGITYGISISTYECFDKERGAEIAMDRILTQDRPSIDQKGLRGRIGTFSSHMEWLEKNRKLLHKYADYLLEQTEYKINDIIWPQ